MRTFTRATLPRPHPIRTVCRSGGHGPRFCSQFGLGPAFGGGVAVHEADAALEIGTAAQSVTAVDAEDLARNPPALGTAQIADGGGDVLDRAEPADRHL